MKTMANFNTVMDRVFDAEFSKASDHLHFNQGESSYTYMGVYPFTKLKSSHLITEAVEDYGSVKDASIALSLNDELTGEVIDFYYNNFWVPMHLHHIESTKKTAEIMVFVVNVGIGRKKSIIKAIQRIIGTKPDGIFGNKTLKAFNEIDEDLFSKKFDEYEIKFYRRLVQKNPRLSWALRGWENRARLV